MILNCTDKNKIKNLFWQNTLFIKNFLLQIKNLKINMCLFLNYLINSACINSL